MLAVPVKLIYPEHLIKEPILAHAIKKYDVTPSIRRAGVDEGEGYLICEFMGEENQIKDSLEWIKSQGVEVEILGAEL